MFISKGVKIYAELDKALIESDDVCEIVYAGLDALRGTPEHSELKGECEDLIDSYRFSGMDVWETFDMYEVQEHILEALEEYAPEGYTFGALIHNSAVHGYWKVNDCDTI